MTFSFGSGPRYMIDRELRDANDMKERGRRLRAAKAISAANACDGTTLMRAVEGFSWSRTAGDGRLDTGTATTPD